MLTKALNLPATIMTGYNGTEDQMAMRRGEFRASILALLVGKLCEERLWPFPCQIGMQPNHLPQLSAQVSDPLPSHSSRWWTQGEIAPAGPQIFRLIVLPLCAIPTKAMQDTELQARPRSSSGRSIQPVTCGFKMMQDALDQTPETIALLKGAMGVNKTSQMMFRA